MKSAPGINFKLRAARTKLKAFKRDVHRFVESGAYEIRPEKHVSRRDPSLYQVSFRLFKTKRLPASRWTLWIDEITYHLRSALDAAVYDLSVTPDRPDPTETGFTGFPIALTKGDFKSNWIRYLTESQQAFIKSVQPYNRPDDPLWLLHTINILNKHRVMQFAGVIVALDQRDFADNMRITVSDLELVRADLRAASWAEDGAEFVRLIYRKTGPRPSVKVNMNFQIEIRFAEPSITSSWHAGILTEQAMGRVEEIISTLYSLAKT